MEIPSVMRTTEIDPVAEPVVPGPTGPGPEPLSLAHRIATLVVILVPPVGLVGAIYDVATGKVTFLEP